MPLDPSPPHRISTKMMSNSVIAEYDHDNQWLALFGTDGGARLNFKPESAKALQRFLNDRLVSHLQKLQRRLGQSEYFVRWDNGEITIISGNYDLPLSRPETSKLREFLNTELHNA